MTSHAMPYPCFHVLRICVYNKSRHALLCSALFGGIYIKCTWKENKKKEYKSKTRKFDHDEY